MKPKKKFKDPDVMLSIPVITIDGPSGVGKGTLSKFLAKQYHFHLLDSGAIYRLLALACLTRQCDLNDEKQVLEIAKRFNISFQVHDAIVNVFLDDEDVSEKIRDENIGNGASKIAVFLSVREALLAKQREFIKPPGLIADGRDMGTVVFPDAKVKIFLDASVKERANRRYKQLQDKKFNVKLDCILSELEARDQRDRNRRISPLVPASDAYIIDSTDLTIDEVIQHANQYIKQKLNISD